MLSRRHLVLSFFASLSLLALPGCKTGNLEIARKKVVRKKTTIFRSINGSPQENMMKVVDLMGGIDRIVGSHDVIVLKPNVQWWNQGSPNIAAIDTFVSLIMTRPGGFHGEVIIAENNHRGAQPWTKVGWTKTFVRNCDLPGVSNYGDLARQLKKKYGERFSVCHWIDIEAGAKRVYSPADGTGYVLCDGTGGVPLLSISNRIEGANHRQVIMSYPIFQTDKGTIVDLKNGIWSKGAYTEQPLKYINCAALNHHSFYCGVTSAVKNYLGVSDLSGGPDPSQNGKITGKYYNFHSFPFDKWEKGPRTGMLGLEIGRFFNTIRRPDLNITTAEWIGLSNRTEPPVSHTRAICAGTDPVALDYHSAKYILYPNSRIRLHHPEYTKGPFHIDLIQCAQESGYSFDEHDVDIQSFDISKMRLQRDQELKVTGETFWYSDWKSMAKYILGRLC